MAPRLDAPRGGGFSLRSGAIRASKDDAPSGPPPTGPGSAITNEPSYWDVDQGSVGDCYLMAGMAALAHRDPEAIRNAITDNGDGTFDVRLYDAEGERRTFRVSGEFSDGHNGADPTPDDVEGQSWAAIIERGYAQMHGGMEAIGNGGAASDAMSAITGRAPVYIPRSGDDTAEDLRAQLEAAQEADAPVVIGMADETQSEYLYADHAYMFLGIHEVDGQTMVELYDPMGVNDGSREPGELTQLVPLDEVHAWGESLHAVSSV